MAKSERRKQMEAMVLYPLDWLEERSGLVGGVRYFLVRGMHRWGASVFIILLFFHMARVFLYGAYKYPRELNWIVGVFLLILGMFEGFTGYLLPYDQTAYWATVVGMNITANGPFVGTLLGQILQGGPAIGSDTLARFYSLHMLIAPGAIFALIGL